ncbi:hypothetical protein K3495_g6724 [Podosphaera aphanis]|nr:hypothetical protein K3495_g6724 [Podosphaera aphanis]
MPSGRLLNSQNVVTNNLITEDRNVALHAPSLPTNQEESTVEFETEIEAIEEGEDVETENTMDPYAETHQERIANTHRSMQMRLMRLIQGGRTVSIFHDDEDLSQSWMRRLSANPVRRPEFPRVPSEAGIGLMGSGRFGLNEADIVTSSQKRSVWKQNLPLRILDRELAIESPARQKLNQRLMAQGMIPSSNADTIILYDDPVYSGQFSDDGNFFFSTNKDFKVRMYDTSNPLDWRYYKTVSYPYGRWTLTDASLSPDNKYLAYTSIRSNVCLASTDPDDTGDPYSLDLAGGPSGPSARFGASFGIWSIRFSGDGRKLVAGATGGLIIVYDIESRTPIHKIEGHEDDVNSVCFADPSSPHTLYSGSDDSVLKVWDTRSLGDSRAAGVLVGHIEGITYMDSKGDGRYILSNSKDQSVKLWDVRMVMSSQQFYRIRHTRRVNQGNFDYRFERYNEDYWYKDPHDNSLVTFRGHRVLKTLIRCHFSPPGSTNSRYVYSGSEDGKVYIWNLDATLAGVIDVYKATLNSWPSNSRGGWDDPFDDQSMVNPWSTCVRDASWHPNAPVIVASAWNGYGARTGTCTVHVWNEDAEGDEAVPQRQIVDPRLESNST